MTLPSFRLDDEGKKNQLDKIKNQSMKWASGTEQTIKA